MSEESPFEGKKFPCPLCEEKCEIRLSEKCKPYIVCDPCGVQMFIRKTDGIDRMLEYVKSWWR